MRFLLFVFSGLLLAGCIGAGNISAVGEGSAERFPVLTGIDLLGQEREIPAAFEGAYNIVAVAFQREQQEDVNGWIAVADSLMEAREDLRFYEIPVIYEVNAPYRFWINNGMRSGIPALKARERTITVYTDRDAFFGITKMKPEEISLLLLDDKGRVLWRHDGVVSDSAVTELKEVLAKL